MMTQSGERVDRAVLTKHTLNLRKGDMLSLQERFPKIASVVIRRLVSDFVDRLDQPMSESEVCYLIDSIKQEEPSDV